MNDDFLREVYLRLLNQVEEERRLKEEQDRHKKDLALLPYEQVTIYIYIYITR